MRGSVMNCVPMPAEHATLETSDDAVLGGRLILRQPLKGHRVGHDAILLAAATEALPGEHAVDLGTGVGAAGLALARRVPGVDVTLVEIDPALTALASGNAQRNGLGGRVRVLTADIGNAGALAGAGLTPGSADRVLMNPPFNDSVRHKVSPDARRRLAHVGGRDTLPRWLAAASLLLKPGGVLTLIWRAENLDTTLGLLCPDFGDVAVLSVYPRPDAPAVRVLIRTSKGSSQTAPLHAAGLTLSDSLGQPTAAAEALLRGGRTLSFYGNADAK